MKTRNQVAFIIGVIFLALYLLLFKVWSSPDWLKSFFAMFITYFMVMPFLKETTPAFERKMLWVLTFSQVVVSLMMLIDEPFHYLIYRICATVVAAILIFLFYIPREERSQP